MQRDNICYGICPPNICWKSKEMVAHSFLFCLEFPVKFLKQVEVYMKIPEYIGLSTEKQEKYHLR